jgi:hypothetical protein
MKTSCSLALVAAVLISAAWAESAQAQAGVGWYVPDYTYYPNYYGYGPTVVPNSGYLTPYGFVPGVRAYGYGWYPGYGTGLYPGLGSLGGIYYGQGRLAEGLGQYNRDTAAAERELAEARQVDAQTRAQQVRDYWEARRAREEFVREQRAQRRNRPQPAVPFAPPRPAAEEFDPQTAAIHWPQLLQEAEYAAARREVEQLFAARLETGRGGEGTLNYLEIRTAVDKVRDVLEASVGQVPATHWIAANQFLNRLVNEAREAPVVPEAKPN